MSRRIWYWEEDYRAAVDFLRPRHARVQQDLDAAMRRLSDDVTLAGVAACGFHLHVEDDGNGEHYVEILVSPRTRGETQYAITVEGSTIVREYVPMPDEPRPASPVPQRHRGARVLAFRRPTT